MLNDSVLIINGAEQGSFETLAGLTQGCPASCFLYIIAIDPLLQALARIPGVEIVCGFVDDWSAGCRGLHCLGRAAELIRDFERASGQRINREKSAIVPTRRLSRDEVQQCFEQWGWELRVSHRERLLGVYIGLHAGIEDQYVDALEKFEKVLDVYASVKKAFSLVTRIVVTNVFLNTLFSYQNRLFFMPRKLLQEIENKILRFLCPVTWLKLGFLAAAKGLCGTSCELVDLRNANDASLLATHERHLDIRARAVWSLCRWRHGCSKLS